MDAILSKVVDRYSDPKYWEKWADNVQKIAALYEARARTLLNESSDVRPAFDNFLSALRQNLNADVSEDDAIGMLSQHLISKPVFDAVFEDYRFMERNPVSQCHSGHDGHACGQGA